MPITPPSPGFSPGRSLLLLLVVGGASLSPPALGVDWLPNPFSAFGGGDRVEIWSAGDQAVYLEELERGARQNGHPALLEATRLEPIFASLELWREGSFDDGEAVGSVFTAAQARLLASKVATALANARGDQEITFVLAGSQSLGLGFRERFYVTGRVFFAAERLNLIFGEVRGVISKGDQQVARSANIKPGEPGSPSALNRFPTGRRARAVATGYFIRGLGGIDYAVVNDSPRVDWLRIDMLAASAAAERSLKEPEALKLEERLAAQEAEGKLRERAMREEIARLRKEVRELSDEQRLAPAGAAPTPPKAQPIPLPAPTPAPSPSQTKAPSRPAVQPSAPVPAQTQPKAPPPAAPESAQAKAAIPDPGHDPVAAGKVRERLQALKLLRDKGFVTDAEFDRKRKEILGDL